MHAYEDALQLSLDSSAQRVALARSFLTSCSGVIFLEEQLALRPQADRIICEVVDPYHGEHGSDERYRRLVENAQSLLDASQLSGAVAGKKLEWCVVDDYGMGTALLWQDC